MKGRSALAIRREANRVERAWKRERRRNAKTPGMVTRDEIRLDAARQALDWAAGDNAMSMSRIDALNERNYRRAKRRFRRLQVKR